MYFFEYGVLQFRFSKDLLFIVDARYEIGFWFVCLSEVVNMEDKCAIANDITEVTFFRQDLNVAFF